MKLTDHAPRAAFMDTFLSPDATGIEVGCDCGAHAQALLEYAHVKFLHVIDLFENPWCEGYCTGRLSRWSNRVKVHKGSSHDIACTFNPQVPLQKGSHTEPAMQVDFIYIDILHDPITVRESLTDWWPLLKPGGILGYRNYTSCKVGIEPFLAGKRFQIDGYCNEIVIFK